MGKKSVKKECEVCNTEFFVEKYRENTATCCSRKCSSEKSKKVFEKPCEVCNTVFEFIASREDKAKYCSRTCYHKAMSLKGTVEISCHHCSKVFNTSPSKNRKYCSIACNNKDKMETFKPSFTTVRAAMKARGFINKCERCGYNENVNILGVHHKDRDRENNELDNLEVLCPNCHSLEHNKHICH